MGSVQSVTGVNIRKPTCDVAIYPSRGNAITMCGKPAVTSGPDVANVSRNVCANHRYILAEQK